MKIGEKIKYYRQRNNISQKELSENLGITNGMLSNIESGKKNASSSVIAKLCEITNLTYDYWTIDSEYDKNRGELQEINKLLDMMIENDFIKDSSDIKNKIFEDAIYKALQADLQHKLELKKINDDLDKYL